jgi:hypothetical protein
MGIQASAECFGRSLLTRSRRNASIENRRRNKLGGPPRRQTAKSGDQDFRLITRMSARINHNTPPEEVENGLPTTSQRSEAGRNSLNLSMDSFGAMVG